MLSFGNCVDRSDQIVDRSYDEVTRIGMNRMFIRWTGPAPVWPPPPPLKPHAAALRRRVPSAVRRPLRDRTCFDHRDECRFPRETGRSQAPIRQQVGSGSATAFPNRVERCTSSSPLNFYTLHLLCALMSTARLVRVSPYFSSLDMSSIVPARASPHCSSLDM
ncbi:protein AUXIN SIGNALING F-BOX 2-like [Dorcoceras hygrometricum]|uniref:Protein AUXIN SIGNALING F-BOX 2-like n=1 Tax=Dorcoceras hygrometricum TaxID=472368 RepID=A0A2Z7A991_9LAMI|nr:protein AUXIN SIGNALING F-BOX 2-like [Dorcoceras hygrometricum]